MKKQLLFIYITIAASFNLFAQLEGTTAGDTLKQAYFELSGTDLHSLNLLIAGDCTSGLCDVGGDNIVDFYPLQLFMTFEVLADNSELKRVWYRGLDIIYLCNKAIQLTSIESLDDATKERYIAEAKFIRSLMYFELSRVFDNIPLMTEVFPWARGGNFYKDYIPTNRIYPNISQLSDVYNQIEQDLLSAIDHLPLKSTLEDNGIYRATKGAAQSLLAKVYLFESSYAKNYPSDMRFSGMVQKWEESLQKCEEVINSNEYELIGKNRERYDTWWDSSYIYQDSTPGFRYIFTKAGNDCKESVFALRDLSPGSGWRPFGKNGITQFTTARFYFDNPINSLIKGWGFVIPSDRLINEFAAETGDPKDDPRFAVTVAGESDSIFTHGFNYGLGWYPIDFSHSATGNYCRKFEAAPSEFWEVSASWIEGPVNIPVIRYSDVVLMASEAALEKGDTNKTLYYINMVRKRARNSGSTGYPGDLDSVTFRDIVHERQLELACEGHSFYDLVRWNLAYDSINGNYNQSFGQYVTFTKGTNEFFPIPDSVFGTPVDIEEIGTQNSLFKIYPNPGKDIITLEYPYLIKSIELSDINGRVVFRQIGDKNVINVSGFNKGIYILKAETDKMTLIENFIKE